MVNLAYHNPFHELLLNQNVHIFLLKTLYYPNIKVIENSLFSLNNIIATHFHEWK